MKQPVVGSVIIGEIPMSVEDGYVQPILDALAENPDKAVTFVTDYRSQVIKTLKRMARSRGLWIMENGAPSTYGVSYNPNEVTVWIARSITHRAKAIERAAANKGIREPEVLEHASRLADDGFVLLWPVGNAIGHTTVGALKRIAEILRLHGWTKVQRRMPDGPRWGYENRADNNDLVILGDVLGWAKKLHMDGWVSLRGLLEATGISERQLKRIMRRCDWNRRSRKRGNITEQGFYKIPAKV